MKRPNSPDSPSRAGSTGRAKPATLKATKSAMPAKAATRVDAGESGSRTRGFDRAALGAALLEQRRKAAWLGGFQFSTFSLVLALVLVVGILSLVPRVQQLAAQQAEINALKAELAQTRDDIERMRQERVQWTDSSFLASEARERLFYVMPGDVSYLVINDLAPEALTLPETQLSTELQRTETDWLASLFGSVWVAAQTPVPAEATP